MRRGEGPTLLTISGELQGVGVAVQARAVRRWLNAEDNAEAIAETVDKVLCGVEEGECQTACFDLVGTLGRLFAIPLYCQCSNTRHSLGQDESSALARLCGRGPPRQLDPPATVVADPPRRPRPTTAAAAMGGCPP